MSYIHINLKLEYLLSGQRRGLLSPSPTYLDPWKPEDHPLVFPSPILITLMGDPARKLGYSARREPQTKNTHPNSLSILSILPFPIINMLNGGKMANSHYNHKTHIIGATHQFFATQSLYASHMNFKNQRDDASHLYCETHVEAASHREDATQYLYASHMKFENHNIHTSHKNFNNHRNRASHTHSATHGIVAGTESALFLNSPLQFIKNYIKTKPN